MVPARTHGTDALRVTGGLRIFLDRCNACKHCGYGVLLFSALHGKVRGLCIDLESKSKPENCVKRARSWNQNGRVLCQIKKFTALPNHRVQHDVYAVAKPKVNVG